MLLITIAKKLKNQTQEQHIKCIYQLRSVDHGHVIMNNFSLLVKI